MLTLAILLVVAVAGGVAMQALADYLYKRHQRAAAPAPTLRPLRSDGGIHDVDDDDLTDEAAWYQAHNPLMGEPSGWDEDGTPTYY